METNQTFDPVKYSIEENQFLFDNLGKAPKVAMRSLPAGLNPKAVQPILQEVYDLEEVKKHSGEDWIGIEALKGSIEAYLRESQKWATDRRRGAPRFPSMHSFDSRKRAHRSGPGADNGQVRTYFDKTGQRQAFAVGLIPESTTEWTPEWGPTADEPTKASGLLIDHEAHRIECQVCKHTESFNGDNRGSYNAARARISKHLRLAKTDVDAHREIYTNEFGS